MNRPNINDYRTKEPITDYYDFARYESELESYCDELERMNQSVVKALDKALEIMTSGLDCSECKTCYAFEHHFRCTDKKGWKRYLLKDE